jgi:septal ring factor EnvC (AmiA/AmiB activator)
VTPQEAVALIGGAAGVIGGWFAWSKSHAERDNLAVDTMRDVLEEVRNQLAREQETRSRCEERLEMMAQEIRAVRVQLVRTENQVESQAGKVARLEAWVRAQGADPEGIHRTT